MSTGGNNPENEVEDDGTQTPAERRRRRGGFNPADLFNMLPRIDIGSILIMGAVAVAGFFFFRSEGGQDALRGLINMLPEGWRNPLLAGINNFFPGFAPEAANEMAENMTAEQARGHMEGKVPAEIAAVIAKDDATWRDFVGQVREAGGDIMNPISDKVIYQLLTRRPQMVQDILRALPRGEGASTAEAQETIGKVKTALRAIVADPARFNTLLSGEHFTNTMNALQAVSPIPFHDGALATFVQATGMQNGQPTPALRGFVNAMLSDNDAERIAALNNFMRTADTTAVSQLFRDVSLSEVTDPTLRNLITVAKNKQNLDAYQTLTTQLSDTQIESLRTALSASMQNPNAVLTLLRTDPAMSEAVVAFARTADIGTMPAGWREGLSLARGGTVAIQAAGALASSVDVGEWTNLIAPAGTNPTTADMAENLVYTLLNKNMRDQLLQNNNLFNIGTMMKTQLEGTTGEAREGLEFLTVQTRNAGGQLVYSNLSSLHAFASVIDSNPRNSGSNREQTLDVMGKLTRFIVSGDKAELASLDPALVSRFFGDAYNSEAFRILLNNINVSTLPADRQVVLRELRQHWGNGQAGISEMLADPASVQFMLNMLSGQQSTQNPFGDTGVSLALRFGLGGVTQKMSENRVAIEDMMRDLRTAGVSLEGGAAPAARTGGPAPARS